MAALQEFITKAHTEGFARTNRFLVTIQGEEKNELLKLFCESADMPGLSFESQGVLMFGEERQLPYNRSFGDSLSLSFYVDTNLKVKKYFDDWTNNIIHPTYRIMNYYSSYVKTVRVRFIDELSGSDKENHSKYGLILHEAWPKTIGKFSLNNNDSTNSILKLTVTMQYKYWTVDPNPDDN